jgi:hypothetical protein
MAPPRRHALVIVAVVAFAAVVTVVGLIGAGGITLGGLSATTTTLPAQADPLTRFLAVESRALHAATRSLAVSLPSRAGAPAPSWPASPWRVPLASHEVVGFVPWYELGAVGSAGSVPASDFSTLVYFSLAIGPDGALATTPGPNNGGYDDLANGGAGALVASGHRAGAQVLLALASATQSTIDTLASNPSAAGKKMASETIPLLKKYGFDGVDIDIEGQATGDRSGYVTFVRAFSSALRAVDATWAIMLNTYPNSADDPTGFFDVKALSASVSDFFVMAYDMNDFQVPSASAPLQGIDVSDATALATYADAGLARKVILGLPFYGYDYTATKAGPGAAAIGSPYSVSYSAVVHAARPVLWDPVSETPYSAFRRGGKWHQTWFDDPVSIALKTALAAQFHVAGVGAWELGMVSGQPQMVDAMLGGAAPMRLTLARQP